MCASRTRGGFGPGRRAVACGGGAAARTPERRGPQGRQEWAFVSRGDGRHWGRVFFRRLWFPLRIVIGHRLFRSSSRRWGTWGIHIAIPAFFPTSVRDSTTGGTTINLEWTRVSDAGATVRIVVPDGSTNDLLDDSTFPPFHPLTDARNQFVCRSQQQRVLGYVSTRSARRSRRTSMPM
jgi:hypothetical protein